LYSGPIRTEYLNEFLKELETVEGEYTDWFMQATRCFFYPGMNSKVIGRPMSFTQWMRVSETKKVIEPEVLAGLDRLHDDLAQGIEQMLAQVQRTQKAPDYKDYDQLATFFEEFVNTLRRIGRHYQVGGTEIDPLTGLRTREMFFKDIRREADRLARQGKPFCIAVCRIDNQESMRKNAATPEYDECLQLIAKSIKKCLRSFDDAYRMDNDTLVLALKQTGVSGGMTALYRLKEIMQKDKLTYVMEGKSCELTLTSCVTEPVPEDDIRQLLMNMEKDIYKLATHPGAVVEYREVSPLQRFINEGRE
jgi:diguanylate cyclase